ncbi:beta-ketoacyl-[acyl-carrier-protein] synthase family protein [Rhizobium leguminosarum]|uniref:beta-ketoacyl-[acyl-carrier-protein] synthase family protein n=1 Tax=Rhizobium leguminosarum TaxID=384 RepID=UPI0021BC13F9|nr:beta-ketoacyl-[acyl-carrier-protein] synthase family protein [Rhizobium leguminosarum]
MSASRVVVTGLGIIAPNGIGKHAFWNNICAGVSGLKPNPAGASFGFKSRVFGAIAEFDNVSTAPGGRHQAFAMEAARMAVADGEIGLAAVNAQRFGVCIASAIAGAAEMEGNLLKLMAWEAAETHAGRFPELPAHALESFDFGLAATSVASHLGVGGMVVNLSTGCTAGLDALGFAYNQIRSGAMDIMLAGASEAPLCPLSIGAFEALGALSTRFTDDPRLASTPFSADRDGFVISEGCGMLLLESYDHAVARNARIYAEVTGYASVNNAYHMTDLPPSGEALARCMELALTDARIERSEIDHISAHGSSTPQNDVNETGAIRSVFGQLADTIPVNALKSMTGHALAAANAIECVALSLQLYHQKLHPTVNYCNPDPACDLDYVVGAERHTRIRSAMKLASGFSGIHSVLVMRADQP